MWLSVTSREGSCDPRCRQGAECSPQGTRSHRPPLTRVLLLKPASRVSRAWDRPGRGLWSVALPLSRTPGAGPCSQRGPSSAEQHSADAPGGRRPCRFQATLSTHRAALSGGTAAPAGGRGGLRAGLGHLGARVLCCAAVALRPVPGARAALSSRGSQAGPRPCCGRASGIPRVVGLRGPLRQTPSRGSIALASLCHPCLAPQSSRDSHGPPTPPCITVF